MTQKKFTPADERGGGNEKITFPPLNYDQKVEFWPCLAFLACCVQHCSYFRTSALVQLASLESSDPFYAGGSTRKSLCGPGGTIYGKIHSHAAANTFYPPQKNFFEFCEHS